MRPHDRPSRVERHVDAGKANLVVSEPARTVDEIAVSLIVETLIPGNPDGTAAVFDKYSVRVTGTTTTGDAITVRYSTEAPRNGDLPLTSVPAPIRPHLLERSRLSTLWCELLTHPDDFVTTRNKGALILSEMAHLGRGGTARTPRLRPQPVPGTDTTEPANPTAPPAHTWRVQVRPDVHQFVTADTVTIDHGGTLTFRDRFGTPTIGFAPGAWVTFQADTN